MTDHRVTIEADVAEVYERLLDVAAFPRFMTAVRSVQVGPGGGQHWIVQLGRGTKEFDAFGTADGPRKGITWKSEAGLQHHGVVGFERHGEGGTRMTVSAFFEPHGVGEWLAHRSGLVDRAIGHALRQFKDAVESSAGRGARTADRTSPDTTREGAPTPVAGDEALAGAPVSDPQASPADAAATIKASMDQARESIAASEEAAEAERDDDAPPTPVPPGPPSSTPAPPEGAPTTGPDTVHTHPETQSGTISRELLVGLLQMRHQDNRLRTALTLPAVIDVAAHRDVLQTLGISGTDLAQLQTEFGGYADPHSDD